MGFKFDEKTLIDNNIFKYEEKLNTQYTRFLDKTPVYVTYFNLITAESTLDLGFSNVESKIGNDSPLRYSEIKNFPVYGIDGIQFTLSEEEAGLDCDYEGELIILPGTIIPHQDDYFIIEHKGKDLLFNIISVEYDTIKSNNFFKVGFSIKYVDKEDTEDLFKQVTDKFTCVVDNIGTEDKCIIRDDEWELIQRLQMIYGELSTKYIMYFYNKKYNAFIYVDEYGRTVYDRYLNHFIQKHELVYDSETHKCIYLSNEDETCDFGIEYDRSIYKAYEIRKPKRFKESKFRLTPIENIFSIFAYYGTHKCCKSVRFNRGVMDYIDKGLSKAIQTGNIDCNAGDETDMPIFHLQKFMPESNGNETPFDEIDLLIIKYMNDLVESIHSIDMDELEESVFFDLNWNTFIKIPLALYAIKGYYKIFLRKQLDN